MADFGYALKRSEVAVTAVLARRGAGSDDVASQAITDISTA
jgi:hypothetical protein